MNEKGIIFSTPMVRAILDDCKGMTRRIIKCDVSDYRTIGLPEIGVKGCAPYAVGHHLYVKETWRVGAWQEDDGAIAVDYKADGLVRREWIEIEDPEMFERFWIQSTDDAGKAGVTLDSGGAYHWKPGHGPCRWRSARFMPKAVARLWLEVTAIRAERLQEITEADAIAEGVGHGFQMNGAWPDYQHINKHGICELTQDTARMSFATLWDSLNGKRPGCEWSDNPFVFVVAFKKLDKKGGEQ